MWSYQICLRKLRGIRYAYQPSSDPCTVHKSDARCARHQAYRDHNCRWPLGGDDSHPVLTISGAGYSDEDGIEVRYSPLQVDTFLLDWDRPDGETVRFANFSISEVMLTN